MQEVLLGQAPEPAGGQEADDLPGLRVRPTLPAGVAAAAASGLLLSLALPPLDLGPLALVALVPVLWAVRGGRSRRALILGLVFGAVYFGIVLRWLYPLTRMGWSALVLTQAAWVGVALALAAAVWRPRAPVRTALGVATTWTLVEWLRGEWPLDGFTWGGLGYTQHDNPLLLPLASVAGVWGISLVVAAVNVLVLEGLLRLPRSGAGGAWPSPVVPAAVALGLVVAPVAIPLPSPGGPPIDVAVVQGNVPKFDPTLDNPLDIDVVVAENHARLHRELAQDPPDLAIWPENALDQDPTRDPAFAALVEEPVRAVGVPTLVGAITVGDDGRLRNENLLYSADGRVVDRYVKNHLVPFGEFVPWRRYLSWIEALEQVPNDLAPGREPGLFEVSGARFASVICYENAFPDQVRRSVGEDVGFLVVSTNNASYLRGPAADQHVMMSELRAVENGRWVVHASISGISAVVDPRGRASQETGLFEAAVVRAEIPQGSGRTAFNRFGVWVPGLLLVGTVLALAKTRRAPRRDVPPLPGPPRVAVVLPTYNERDTIEEVVRRVLAAAPGVVVVVVDDGSPDGTGDIARRLAAEDPRVTLVERPGKRGLASAYREGFERVLSGGADLVVEMDADLSHAPEELPRLLEAASQHHVVIGSRYVPGGAIRNWGLIRRLLSRGGNLYARILLGFPVRDATSGYRAFRAQIARDLLADRFRSEGYAFQIELAYRAWRRGLSVGEVPITFEERRHGASKLSRRIVVEALWQVAVWGVRDRLLRRRDPAPAPRPPDRAMPERRGPGIDHSPGPPRQRP